MLKLLAATTAMTFNATAQENNPRRLGVCSICYRLRWPPVDRGQASLEDILRFLEHCRELGAGGVQTTIPIARESVRAIRAKLDSSGMYLEGQIALPHKDSGLSAFEARIEAAREAGALVLRTACLAGRRYETFADAAAFRAFAAQAEEALGLVEPIVRKHRIKLAVENHKDWRVPELVRLLERLSSEYVGICVDTGNSIALLEDPLAVVEAYAPYAFATHLKDMAVQEYERGFLISEVALGDGFLDVPRIVRTLRRAQPALQFSLEMIARDPLQVPCLVKSYWASSEAVPGWLLASTLAMVRANTSKLPLPVISPLTPEQKLEAEEKLVQRSLAYARSTLQL
jgi:sugar phosphate isomerase/epimerase